MSVQKCLPMTSFQIHDFCNKKLLRAAIDMVSKITAGELNSNTGIHMSFDRPLGSNHYLVNLLRPAVLRQHFGMKSKHGVYCYGTGSGAKSVGTHPSSMTNRIMPNDMIDLAQTIQTQLNCLQQQSKIPSTIKIEPFNHCTVLFYYHKTKQSSNKMLGFHTDNVYTKSGVFVKGKNSQKENNPTCILTLGADRDIYFQKQMLKSDGNAGRSRWVEVSQYQITQRHNSLFVLSPNDEMPQRCNTSRTIRYRHGVPHFFNKKVLSIALVFRRVTHESKISNSNHPDNVSTIQGITETHIKLAHKSHRSLRRKFKRIFRKEL